LKYLSSLYFKAAIEEALALGFALQALRLFIFGENLAYF